MTKLSASHVKCFLLFAAIFVLQRSLAQEDTESNSPSLAPTDVICENTPGWIYPVSSTDKLSGYDNYTCDDPLVVCSDLGVIGEFSDTYDQPASQHCCKCKDACSALCLSSAPPSTSPTSIGAKDKKVATAAIAVPIIIVVVIGFLCLKANRERDLSSTRRTMAARRRGQSADGTAAELPPADNATRREELLSNFFCQHVLPDKSNVSISSLRFSTIQEVEDDSEEDQSPIEPPSASPSSSPTPVSSREKQKSRFISSARCMPSVPLSSMLAPWRRPSPKDECCICLDGYHPGETICTAKTNKCNHIFHQDCVVEWFMRNHKCCPLCRVNLMN